MNIRFLCTALDASRVTKLTHMYSVVNTAMLVAFLERLDTVVRADKGGRHNTVGGRVG